MKQFTLFLFLNFLFLTQAFPQDCPDNFTDEIDSAIELAELDDIKNIITISDQNQNLHTIFLEGPGIGNPRAMERDTI